MLDAINLINISFRTELHKLKKNLTQAFKKLFRIVSLHFTSLLISSKQFATKTFLKQQFDFLLVEVDRIGGIGVII